MALVSPEAATYRTALGVRTVPARVEDLPGPAGVYDPDGDFGLVVTADGAAFGVSCETALLAYALAEPGPLPAFARRGLLAAGGRALRSLLSSGVLEVEGPDGFVGGAAALSLLDPLPGGDDASAQVRLSAKVLDQAARLDRSAPDELMAWLYTANAVPASQQWRHDVDAGTGPVARAVEAVTKKGWASHRDEAWVHFRARSPVRRPPSGESVRGATWKLYVSPHPDDLATAIGDVAAALAAAGVRRWKVGRGAQGLLRPDKVVAYTSSPKELAVAGQDVSRRLGGVRVQGVPFAAALDAGMLVSWGVDPAPAAGEDPVSWRVHTCRSLAQGLVDASLQGVPLDRRGDHARRLAAVDGVEPETLAPMTWWLEEVGAA